VDTRGVGVLALLDFLLGLSIDEVAIRYRIPRTAAEDELRAVLLAYGFDARGSGR
jgi:hypothetical protein